MSTWDAQTAEWYAHNYGDYPTNRLAVEALDLAVDATIVDVGCGTGSALRHAAAKVTQGTLIGVDPVPRMIEIAREQTATDLAADRIVFQQGTAETLPVGDTVADVVLAFDSFDHWTDPQLGLAEVRRVLRSDGYLVIVKDGGLPGVTKARQAFRKALAEAGFTITSERTVAAAGVSFTMWQCAVTG